MRVTPNRDDRYMGLAFIVASFSKDPSTQCGAIIISSDNEPLGWGYNGPPASIPDDQVNWDRPYKYPYIVHSEINAINYSRSSVKGCTLYVNAPPCKACMLSIVRSKIQKVIYYRNLSDSKSMLSNLEDWKTTQDIANKGNVELIQFSGKLDWLKDRINQLEELNIFTK